MRVVLLALIAAFLVAPTAPALAATVFIVCEHSHPHKSGCVVDGDTFWYRGEKFRPVGFDAPEGKGQYCASEGPIFRAARARLLELLNSGFTIKRLGRVDQYRRPLVEVTVAGRSLANIMIAEGLARRYPGPKWCG